MCDISIVNSLNINKNADFWNCKSVDVEFGDYINAQETVDKWEVLPVVTFRSFVSTVE